MTKLSKPWMSQEEIQMIEKYLSKEDITLEWGSGGSTCYFPQFVKTYYSIEHDEIWYEKVKPLIPNNVFYYLVKLNSPLIRPTKKHQVEDYINFVDTLNIEKFDKVLIDGRGRQWCTEKVIPYLKKDSIIFIHDYWNRPRYHVDEQKFEIIDFIKKGQSLAVLKLK